MIREIISISIYLKHKQIIKGIIRKRWS